MLRKRLATNARNAVDRHKRRTGESHNAIAKAAWPHVQDPARKLRQLFGAEGWCGDRDVELLAKVLDIDAGTLYRKPRGQA